MKLIRRKRTPTTAQRSLDVVRTAVRGLVAQRVARSAFRTYKLVRKLPLLLALGAAAAGIAALARKRKAGGAPEAETWAPTPATPASTPPSSPPSPPVPSARVEDEPLAAPPAASPVAADTGDTPSSTPPSAPPPLDDPAGAVPPPTPIGDPVDPDLNPVETAATGTPEVDEGVVPELDPEVPTDSSPAPELDPGPSGERG